MVVHYSTYYHKYCLMFEPPKIVINHICNSSSSKHSHTEWFHLSFKLFQIGFLFQWVINLVCLWYFIFQYVTKVLNIQQATSGSRKGQNSCFNITGPIKKWDKTYKNLEWERSCDYIASYLTFKIYLACGLLPRYTGQLTLYLPPATPLWPHLLRPGHTLSPKYS